jgi:hypothetical protein
VVDRGDGVGVEGVDDDLLSAGEGGDKAAAFVDAATACVDVREVGGDTGDGAEEGAKGGGESGLEALAEEVGEGEAGGMDFDVHGGILWLRVAGDRKDGEPRRTGDGRGFRGRLVVLTGHDRWRSILGKI